MGRPCMFWPAQRGMMDGSEQGRVPKLGVRFDCAGGDGSMLLYVRMMDTQTITMLGGMRARVYQMIRRS